MRSDQRRNLVIFALPIFLVSCFALVFIGWFTFVPSRPNPSGPHAVGRLELALRGSDGRLIPVTAWYPTAGPRGGQPIQDAPLDAQTPAPLILYSSGWTGTRTVSSIQTENLASHGFVVVACDDYASDIAADPDNGLIFDVSSDAAAIETRARGERHVAKQATILLEILDALERGEAGPLAGRINTERIGVLGYSIGGGAGSEAAARDTRIVAVFNVDGWLIGPSANTPRHGSYFLLSSDELVSVTARASPDPAERNEAILALEDYERNVQRTEGDGNYWVRLNNTDHEDLADRLFALTRRKIFRTNARRQEINATIGAYEVAFFRSTLLGEASRLLLERRSFNQHVRWISPAPPPPGAASPHT